MRFEEMRYGLIKPVVATFYHWAYPEELNERGKLTKDSISNDTPFYVCDDIHTWGSSWLTYMKLYAVDCRIAKPFPLFEQYITREAFDGVEATLNDGHAQVGYYDSVIYTPHPLGRGTREMCLLFPKQQVLSIREIPYDKEELKAMQATNCWNWTRLQGWEAPKSEKETPPWEESVERADIRFMSESAVNEFDLGDGMNYKRTNDPAFNEFLGNMAKLVKQLNDDKEAYREIEEEDTPLSPETMNELRKDRHRAEPKHGLEALGEMAKAERAAMIAKLPLRFHVQQATAASKEGFKLDPDQIIVSRWVYDWQNAIEDVIDALQNDSEALEALSGVTFDVPPPVQYNFQGVVSTLRDVD